MSPLSLSLSSPFLPSSLSPPSALPLSLSSLQVIQEHLKNLGSVAGGGAAALRDLPVGYDRLGGQWWWVDDGSVAGVRLFREEVDASAVAVLPASESEEGKGSKGKKGWPSTRAPSGRRVNW